MAITLKNGKPITASKTAMRSTPNVRANAADTSRDAEKLVRQPPMPFQNSQGVAKIPTGRVDGSRLGIPYTKPSPVNARPQNVGARIGCANTSLSADEMAAIGYSPRATKSSNPIISGFPTSKRKR